MAHVSEGIALRSAVGQASNAYGSANNTANTLGSEAQGIGANLTPFLTQEMLHPQGIGQTGLSAETAAAEGGAGGAASGLTGVADQRAAVSRNAGGFTAALGTPTLCGTGPVGGNAHRDDEWCRIDTMVPRAQALALTILEVAAG